MKIKTPEQHLMSSELKNIVETVPISIRDTINIYNKPTNEMRYLRGLADRIPYRQSGLGFLVDKLGFSEYGIGLAAYCDNIPETLLHEAIHVYRALHKIDIQDTTIDEQETDLMTEEYWKFKDVREAMLNRTIELLGEKGY